MVQNNSLQQLLITLEPFTPLIAGTFPLGIHIEGSDIDILCEANDLDLFEQFAMSTLQDFGLERVQRIQHLVPEAMVLSLVLDDLPVEIFAQPLPIYQQAGFRHMVIEGRLLAMGGSLLADQIRTLKRQGRRTEAAFAEVFHWEGDPFEAILRLEELDGKTLAQLLPVRFS